MQVPEQDRGYDGDTERDGGADGEGEMQTLGECVAGCAEQSVPHAGGKLDSRV